MERNRHVGFAPFAPYGAKPTCILHACSRLIRYSSQLRCNHFWSLLCSCRMQAWIFIIAECRLCTRDLCTVASSVENATSRVVRRCSNSPICSNSRGEHRPATSRVVPILSVPILFQFFQFVPIFPICSNLFQFTANIGRHRGAQG